MNKITIVEKLATSSSRIVCPVKSKEWVTANTIVKYYVSQSFKIFYLSL